MATKPELRRAVANSYIKASDYNYNFDQLNNYIENGIADNAISIYENDREYSKGQWVLANTSNGNGLYESQVDGNKGNSLLDTTYWKKVIIDGDLSSIGEQLAGKADISTPSIQAPYIKNTYVNGTSWYRVWSDGWCEQGGNILVNGTKTLTFLKHFKNTNYNFFVQSTYVNGNTIVMVMNNTKSISSIQISPGYHNSGNSDWIACGYLADGQY